jgi:hypothetical protein
VRERECYGGFPSASTSRKQAAPSASHSTVAFYSGEGDYDMVGNNTPVFFVKDPMTFRHFIRATAEFRGRGVILQAHRRRRASEVQREGTVGPEPEKGAS